jgi:phosphohistidine phosphatase
MAKLLSEQNQKPGRILSSTAVRARSTAEIVAESVGFSGEIAYRPDLYHADPDDYAKALQEIADAAASVLVVGHNPGLEEFLLKLTGELEILPTAAIALVELPITDWRDFRMTRTARLIHLWRPKEL